MIHHDKARRSSFMGGTNYHIDIEFVDGIIWLVRICCFNATSPPPLLRDYILHSEYATMKVLETTTVPSPKAFHIAFEGAVDPVVISHMLIEKNAGQVIAQVRSFDKAKIESRRATRIPIRRDGIFGWS